MEAKKTGTQRQWYFDAINILACFCVVVMHCNSRINVYGTGKGWNLAVLLHCLCIWAVTAFFMLSGANLLEYRNKYSTKVFLKKRLLKIVVPFVVWSVIYAVWKSHTGQIEIPSAIEAIRMFCRNEYNVIFWFFYTLIPAYLCIPVLSLITTCKSKKIGWYLFALGFCNLSLFPLIQQFFGIDLALFRFPIGYSPVCLLVLGWLLKKTEVGPKVRAGVYIGAIASVILTYYGTCVYSELGGAYDKCMLTSGSVFSVCIASAIFLFFKTRQEKGLQSVRVKTWLQRISSVSLGVYFVQIIVLYYYRKLDFVDPYSIYSSILWSVFVYAVSLCIVLILKRIPVLKWLVP